MGRGGRDWRLEQAIRAHRRGEIVEASRGYAQVLADDPENVDALQLLGAAMLRQGERDDALRLLDRALELDRRHAPALINRARARRALGEHASAAQDARRATRLRPDLREGWLVLGRALRDAGQLEEAQGAAERAVEEQASGAAGLQLSLRALRGELGEALDCARRDGVRALAEVADALLEAGRCAEAAAVYAEVRSLEDRPAYAAGQGLASLRAGDPEGALAPLRRARELEPGWAFVSLALGRAQLARGAPEEAIGPMARAVRQLDRGWPTLVDALGRSREAGPGLEALLLQALGREDVDAQRLDGAVQRALGEPDLTEAMGRRELAQKPLFCAWLQRVQPASLAWEDRLVELRHHWLEEEAPLPARVALAIAAGGGEFAWACSPEERERIDELVRGLPAALSVEDAQLGVRLARIAAYRSLAELPLAEELAQLTSEHPLYPLVQAQVLHPRQEAALADQLPCWGLLPDPGSRAVRAQYEEHPYPRRFGVQLREPQPLADWLEGRLPGAGPWPRGELSVLVAGCGTGQHALTSAATWSNVRVTGVDLSRASLGCARRRAEELGLELELAQADLLALDRVGVRFDVVEAVGVLHHVDDPVRALSILTGCVKPGGLMRLGLYSKAARQDVVAAQQALAATGLDPSRAEDLRSARQQLRALPPGHPARGVLRSPDYYSLSGLRDLLFHAREHRFDLAGLRGLIEGVGLDFLGFQHIDPRVLARYDARAGAAGPRRDWALWAALEAEDPRMFRGMYLAWCRLPAEPDRRAGARGRI